MEIRRRLADVLIVTVNEYETKAITQAFEKATGGPAEPVSMDGRVYGNLGTINGTKVFHALSEMGSTSPGAAQSTIDKAIRVLNPDAVIAVGVVFGMNANKQAIGDILLSRQLRLYEVQRVGPMKIIPRGDKAHASTRLINFFHRAAQTSWVGARVQVGVILTGEKLVDNNDLRNHLNSIEPEALGGEMEGGGLYVACQEHKVDWIVIKAICDWADGDKGRNKTARQKTAARNAAEFVVHSLKQAPLALTSKPLGLDSLGVMLAMVPGLVTFDDWSRHPTNTTPLERKPPIERRIAELRDALRQLKKKVFRFRPSEARLVFEALRSPDLTQRAAYVDLHDEADRMASKYVALRVARVEGILVIGNCPYAEYLSLESEAAHPDSRVVVIALTTHPDQKAAHQLLVDRSAALDAGDYEKTIALGEEAVLLARKSADREELALALRCVIIDTTDWLGLAQWSRQEETNLIRRIRTHLEELETLDPPRAQLLLEKASLAQIEGRHEDALHYAELAIREAEDADTEAEATLFCLRTSWHEGLEEHGVALRDRVQALLTHASSAEMKLMLGADWLSTLCRAGKATAADIEQFTAQMRSSGASKKFLGIVSKVVSDFGRSGNLDAMRHLLQAAMDMAVSLDDAATAANIALDIARLEAESRNAAAAIQQIGVARGWVEKLRPPKGGGRWATAMVNTLRQVGEVYSLLASKIRSEENDRAIGYQRSAYEALQATMEFLAEHDAEIAGPVAAFRAELDARLGEVAEQLGRHAEAALHFRRARTEFVMADETLFGSIGAKAYVDEAGALFCSGHVNEARHLLSEILGHPAIPDNLRNVAQHNMKVLEKSILPVVDWLASPAAQAIGATVAQDGLRAAVAELTRPLGEWMDELSATFQGPVPFSGLFDQWGRGGFARLVAAIRADPLNAVAVDATSVADIERMARIFCPLYDTTIVCWKGSLEGKLALFPVSGSSRNCGIGYSLLAFEGGSGCGLGGWANLLPDAVATFLGTVARPLITSGRLVVVPAPLVGSTQSLVGWTDNILVDYFFGGVIKSVRMDSRPQGSAMEEGTPLRDFGALRLPVIDGIPLRDLNAILEDTTEWVSPFRRLLGQALGNDNIRQERWGRVGPEIQDMRDALRYLDEKWRTALPVGGSKARVMQLTCAFSAGQRSEECPGADPLTLFARAIAGAHPDLGPWIPFWRLHNIGAAIHWIHPLDNRSTPAPIEIERSRSAIDPNHEGWLYPGEGGPGIRRSVRVPLNFKDEQPSAAD